jgi:putative heme iron utilization protein
MDRESQSTLAQLIRSQEMASLGTLRKGEPMVSMVLYAHAKDFSEFYINISRLAMHTQNILKHPQISLLIYDPEYPTGNPQATVRVSISGIADIVHPTGSEYESAKRFYLEKHPSAAMTFQLGDFSIYRIRPKSGRYVAGFGKIFNITQQDLVQVSVRN